MDKIIRVTREILAILLWTYIPIKLFIYDVDQLLIKNVDPGYYWIIEYRIFILLGIISLVWAFSDSKVFLRNFFFVLLYPIIIFGKLLYKRWAIIIIFLPAFYGFFKRLKLRFISFTLAVISSLLLLLNISNAINILSIFLLIVFLSIHFILRLQALFSSRNIFNIVSEKLFSGIDDNTSIANMQIISEHEALQVIPPDSKAYTDKRKTNLVSIVLVHTLYEKVLNKLKNFRESRVLDLYGIFATLYTLFLITICFSFIYLGLFNIDSTLFLTPTFQPNYFTFFNLSLARFLADDLVSLQPAKNVSQFFSYMESILVWVTALSIFYAFTTPYRERYHSAIKNFISALEKRVDKNLFFLNQLYNIDFVQAKDESGFDLDKLAESIKNRKLKSKDKSRGDKV